MAEALGAAGSIVGIVAFGLQLATTLQTYVEAALEAEERLRDIAFDINSTASALKQLQDIIDADQVDGALRKSPRVFKDEGLKEVVAMAAQCGKVYGIIVMLVTEAGISDGKGKETSGKGKEKSFTFSPDMRTLKMSSLTRRLKWPWLEPRIKRCQEQLRWLKMNLLFNLQLASLARLQLGTNERPQGKFEEEAALRIMASRIRQQEIEFAKNRASKHSKHPKTPSIRRRVSSPYDSNTSLLNASSDLPVQNAPQLEEVKVDFRESNKSNGSPELVADETVVMDKYSIISRSDEKHTKSSSDKARHHTPDDILLDPADAKRDAPLQVASNIKPVTNIASSETDAHNLDGNKFEKEENANVEEIFVEDQVLPTAAGHTAIKHTSQDPSAQLPPQKLAENDEGAVKVLPFGGSERKSRILPSWLSGFGHFNKLSQHAESRTLEAFIIPATATTDSPLKLPLGHDGLKKMKKKLSLSWDQYASLNYQHHKRINQALLDAKQHDARERNCVAAGLYKGVDEEKLLAFFSLGAEPKPIHFKDALGREFRFPYEHCRTWDMVRVLITDAFSHMDGLEHRVSRGCYDILDEDEKTVLPKLFETMIRPGCHLTMRLWKETTPSQQDGLTLLKEEALAKAMAPTGKETKQPISFKDAVGRKFTFPFHLVAVWAGMDELIQQIFAQVEGISLHVAKGHYDLIGPNGEIILPQVWETVVEPGWSITMSMWPMPEPSRGTPPRSRGPPPPPPAHVLPGPSRRKRGSDDGVDREVVDSTSDVASDSDAEDLDEDFGMEVDFEKETEKAKLSLGELLGKYTNATDTVAEMMDDGSTTGSDSDSLVSE